MTYTLDLFRSFIKRASKCIMLCNWQRESTFLRSIFLIPPVTSLLTRMLGILNLNKPPGMSSRDAVNAVVRCTGRKIKGGHAGTLDPIAQGVLIVLIGKATRLADFVHHYPKSYSGTFRIGYQSNTDDSEGEVVQIEDAPEITLGDLQDACSAFIGEIQQVPPRFSAVKINGKRAYKLARRGESVDIPPRQVTIHNLEVSRYSDPEFDLEMTCSTGTYVRSVGRDLARNLGSQAIMTDLTRSSIGPFGISDSISVEELKKLDANSLEQKLLSPFMAISDAPVIKLNSELVKMICNGRFIDDPNGGEQTWLGCTDESGNPIAILKRTDDGQLRPKVVLRPDV